MAIIRILLADDHPSLRAGIRARLVKEEDFAVVGETDSGLKALELVDTLHPHVLVLDMQLPDISGIEVARRLSAAENPVRILMLSAYHNQAYLSALRGCGIAGYLTKQEPLEMIVHAVRGVANGETGWVSREVAAILMQRASAPRPASSADVLSHDDADTALDEPDHARGDAPNEFAGRRVLHFEIIDKLGSGGMGVVYRARDLNLDRSVALKFLPPSLSRDEAAKKRFIIEAKAASAQDNPHIGVVYEIGATNDGQLFIAMAYYHGETLKDKIDRGPLSIDEALDYAAQIADGLEAAHAAGIVHRDVKPANILVTDRGLVKIVDFGLAKMTDVSLTQSGTTLGTIAYMSPEQSRGESVDHRTDIWSLGVVLYEMLTGKRPFPGEYSAAVIYAIENQEPVPVKELRADVPESLADAVAKCLQKDPAMRPEQVTKVLADVRSVPAETASQQAADRPSERSRRTRRRMAIAAAMTLCLLVLMLVGRRFLPQEHAPITSLAVLPLANLSGDPSHEYLADGMTDELIDRLGRIEALRVISRTSVMQYKATGKSLPDIARELGVAAIVEGSVQSFGESVRVRVRLIEARSEKQLWNGGFNRDMRDVLRLQSDLALAIAAEIRAQVSPQEEARLQQTRTVEPTAYRLYLQGRLLREMGTADSWHLATEYLEESIARDSTYAPAYAWLATLYVLRGYDDLSRETALRNGRESLEQAFLLDPELSEAHATEALIREVYEWKWTDAEESFKYAIYLDPGNSDARREYGLFLARLGRYEEALTELEHALVMDPLRISGHTDVAYAYIGMHEYENAVAVLLDAHEIDPNHADVLYSLMHAYVHDGRLEEAEEMCERLMTVDPSQLYCHGYSHAVSGEFTEAQRVVDKMTADWTSEPSDALAWEIAWIYADMGELDEALNWLEHLEEKRSIWIVNIRMHALGSLGSEPRYHAMLDRMGLAQAQRTG